MRGKSTPQPARGALGPMSAAVFYGTTAVAMGFINKAVMSVYGLVESNFMLLTQMVVTVVVMFALRAAGAVQFAPINHAMAKRLLPVAIL